MTPVPSAAPPQSGSPAPPVSWKELLIVFGFGLFGGFAASVLTQVTHGGLFGAWPWRLDAPAEMMFGGIASLAGVYVFMRTNIMTPPTIVFALLCGLTWNPIITGAQDYVKNYAGKQSAESAQTADSQLKNLPQASPSAATTLVQNAADSVAAPLSKLNDVGQSQDKGAIVSAADGVINKVAGAPTVDAGAKIKALQTIGSAAANSSPATKEKAIDALNKIALENPAVKNQVFEAVQSMKPSSTSQK